MNRVRQARGVNQAKMGKTALQVMMVSLVILVDLEVLVEMVNLVRKEIQDSLAPQESLFQDLDQAEWDQKVIWDCQDFQGRKETAAYLAFKGHPAYKGLQVFLAVAHLVVMVFQEKEDRREMQGFLEFPSQAALDLTEDPAIPGHQALLGHLVQQHHLVLVYANQDHKVSRESKAF